MQSDEIANILDSLLPGQSTIHHTLIAGLPSGTPVYLSVYVYKGLESGPTLLISGGLHGDEVNGVEIVRRLIESENLKVKKGNVIAIPLINIYGFLNFNRELPDGKDANRSFPGVKMGSLASRVAWHVTNMILPNIDMGIDFHTGGANRSNFPQVRCDFLDSTAIEMATLFSPPLIVNSTYIDGSLRYEAKKYGKSIVVYEAGQSLRFSEFAIEHGIAGTLRFLYKYGFTDANPTDMIQLPPIIINRSTWIRAEDAGLFQFYIDEGMQIQEGQKLGQISDPFNEYQRIVTSPVNGFAIGVNYSPVVYAGDALIHIGLVDVDGT